jgi:Transposase DDE domain group 1
VVAAFDGGAITSDAGALLLGETDRAIRLTERFAACFSDTRAVELVEHQVATLVTQRVVGGRFATTRWLAWNPCAAMP